MKKQIDWKAIQEDYDNNKITTRAICCKYGFCQRTLNRAVKNGLFKSRTISQARAVSNFKLKHTEESKKKISEIRKRFLKENPEKVPYLLNHSSKPSYPETYFSVIEKFGYIKKHRILTYELDFANPANKLAIEIDGDQHYLDPRITAHDKVRNLALSQLGWKIVRIRWSAFQAASQEEKEFIFKSLEYQNFSESFIVSIIEPNADHKLICAYLEKQKEKQTPKQKRERKLLKNWPSNEELAKLVWQKSMLKLAKELGISDKGIKKRCLKLGIQTPPMGYWNKIGGGIETRTRNQ